MSKDNDTTGADIRTPPPGSPVSTSSPNAELVVRVTDEDEDEVELEIEDEEEAPRSFPFRMCGVAFLFLAVVAAILLAALPATYGQSELTNTANGVLFHVLIGIFLLFLFSCLFFTYYLGGSRDTWEDPIFTGIRLNFPNVTAVVGLLLEFLQLVSFSLNKGAVFTGSKDLLNLQYVANPYGQGESFVVMYWIMFVVAFSPYIFVVSVRLIIYSINRRSGEAKAAAFVQKYQQKIYSILWILVNTIYIPVISTMMSGVDCTFTDPDKKTLDSDTNMTCLSAPHMKYIICTMIALVIYYPAASFAQAQTQSISDIKFKPKIVFVFVQGKVLLVAANVFFTDYTQYYLGFVLVIDFVFLVVNLWKAPCLVQWINQLRSVFFVISLVTVVASLIATGKNVSQDAPLAILIIGWVGAAVGMPISFYAWYRIKAAAK